MTHEPYISTHETHRQYNISHKNFIMSDTRDMQKYIMTLEMTQETRRKYIILNELIS